jgi:hypothetical protein
MQPANQSITGTITRLHDEEFELADDAGDKHRFHVAMDIALDAGPIPELQRDGRRVVVDYDDETPAGHVAHRISPAPAAPR